MLVRYTRPDTGLIVTYTGLNQTPKTDGREVKSQRIIVLQTNTRCEEGEVILRGCTRALGPDRLITPDERFWGPNSEPSQHPYTEINLRYSELVPSQQLYSSSRNERQSKDSKLLYRISMVFLGCSPPDVLSLPSFISSRSDSLRVSDSNS